MNECADLNGVLTQLRRFGIVGVSTNAAGYCIYLLVTWAGLPPKLAMSGLYALGAVMGFFLNRRWTFGHSGGISGAGLRFALAHGLGYLINFTMLSVLHDQMEWPHQWVQALAVIVVAGFLFVSFRLFVFPVARTS